MGSVDIALHGFDKRITVEVSVNTQSDWESSNIAKCLSANYDYVVLLSSEKEHLQKLEENISSEFKPQFENRIIKTLTPPQLIAFLDEVRAESSSSEQTVSGYKVKVNYIASTKQEQKLREEAIAKIMLGA